MNTRALMGVAVSSTLLVVSLAACAADVRHAPDAHMDQNADRYRYTYDDGVCNYEYEFDFKDLTDHLNQHGDCRNVPIQRYHAQAAITPAYPPPAAAPPAATPPAATDATPSVTVGTPAQATPTPPAAASSGIAVTPLR